MHTTKYTSRADVRGKKQLLIRVFIPDDEAFPIQPFDDAMTTIDHSTNSTTGQGLDNIWAVELRLPLLSINSWMANN